MTIPEKLDAMPTRPVITPQPGPTPKPMPKPEPQLKEKKGDNIGGILLILLIVEADGGAFYYFKVLKPKQAVSDSVDVSILMNWILMTRTEIILI